MFIRVITPSLYIYLSYNRFHVCCALYIITYQNPMLTKHTSLLDVATCLYYLIIIIIIIAIIIII